MSLRLKFNQRPSTTLGAAINILKKTEKWGKAFILFSHHLYSRFIKANFFKSRHPPFWTGMCVTPSRKCYVLIIFSYNGLQTLMMEVTTLGLWSLNSCMLVTGKFLWTASIKVVYMIQENNISGWLFTLFLALFLSILIRRLGWIVSFRVFFQPILGWV